MSLIEDLCQVTVFDRQGCDVMRSLYKTVDPFRFNGSGIIPKFQSNESQTYYYCDVGYDGCPFGKQVTIHVARSLLNALVEVVCFRGTADALLTSAESGLLTGRCRCSPA